MDYLAGSYVSPLAKLASLAFLLGAGAALVTLAIQVLTWLKTAHWPGFRLSDAVGAPHLPHTSWLGLQIILQELQRGLDRVVEMPLALGLVLLGLLVAAILVLLAAVSARIERQK
jgi:hypothetical protein